MHIIFFKKIEKQVILKPLTERWFLFQRAHSQKGKSEQNSCYVKLFRPLKCLLKDECFFKLTYALKKKKKNHQEPPELIQDWGNRFLEGTNKTLCTPGPKRKEQWPHKILTQTCTWVSWSLPRRHASAVACFRVRGTECSSVSMGPFEGGHYYLH